MQQLRNIGLNSTYVEVWKEGYTEFPSQTMQNLIGVSYRVNPSPGTGAIQRDLLNETLIQSHRNGLVNIAWFEYGLAAKFGNPTASGTTLVNYMRDRGWLLQDSAGSFTNSSNGFSWMNPLVPEVRNLMKSVVLDAVRNYDLDGIQFDDRLAWPVQFGYDNYTRAQYLAETGQQVPASYNNSAFKAWRAQKVTAFAQEIIAAIRAERPGIIISSSPAVGGWAYDNYLVDWPQWQQLGMFDEFVPQVYRSNYTDFNRDWDGTGSITTQGQIQYMGTRRGDFAAGIAINTSPLVTWTDAEQMVNLVRATTPAVAGHVWWYSSSVLSSYPTQMTAYYNVAGLGRAERPDVPAGWRPMPTVAARDVANFALWHATVPAPGRYRVIKQVGSSWVEISSTLYPAGALDIGVSGADGIELLVDRRPFLLGDSDLDGGVDIDDFGVLAANFNLAGRTWAQGDYNLDRVVNIDDFGILAANFNTTLASANLNSRAVPEPTALVLALALPLRRRR